MAKESGLAWTALDVDDEAGAAQDIRAATNSLDFSCTRNIAEVTGLDKSAMERLHLLADFSVTPNFTFDDATADSPHDVFADLSNTRTVLITVSAQILSNECLFTEYSFSRGADGSLTGSASGVLQSGTVPTWTT